MIEANQLFKYQGKVTKVVDADTIDIEIDLGFKVGIKIRMRLAAIDAFELSDPSGAGKVARQFVVDAIMDKTVRLDSHGKDKYGRWLTDVFYENPEGKWKDLGQELIDKGLAKLW